MIDKRSNTFFYLIGLSALAFYCTVIYQNAYNIPKWDDYQEILLFLNRWLSATSIHEHFSAFISQTNEHILLVNHIIILIQYYLIGHLNFAWLIYIGNIFYIGTAFVIFLFFKEQSERAYIFALVMLTGVSFYSYESTLWAMTAISNQAVIFFSLLSLYLVSREKCKLSLVMCHAGLAAFSQSNGLFVLLIIGFYFYHSRQKENLIKWLIFSGLVIGLYAYWFNPTSTKDSKVLETLLSLPWKTFLLTIPAFIASFGGMIFFAANQTSIILSVLIGILFCVFFLRQLKLGNYQTPALLALSFLLMSIASIAFYRGLLGGLNIAYISHYKMYACDFMMLALLASPTIMERITGLKTWKISALVFCSLFFLWSFYLNLSYSRLIDGDLQQSFKYWIEDGDLRRAKGYFVKDADTYLFTALKQKTYTPMVLLPEKSIVHDLLTLPSCPIDESTQMPRTDILTITHKNPNAAGIKVTLGMPEPTEVSVTLCSEQKNYQFSFDVHNITSGESVHYIPREDIIPESYRVYIHLNNTNYQTNSLFINKINKR